jgi:hypothetical protein
MKRTYRYQTVRTVCRLPRVYRLRELVTLRQFDEYLSARPAEEQLALRVAVAAMVKVLAPKRVAGLGGLMECRGCGAVGVDALRIGHRNCLWRSLTG